MHEKANNHSDFQVPSPTRLLQEERFSPPCNESIVRSVVVLYVGVEIPVPPSLSSGTIAESSTAPLTNLKRVSQLRQPLLYITSGAQRTRRH